MNNGYIILSVDYELFGNGSGDVVRHMIEPAWQLADMGRRLGVQFTFFVEIEEYLAFRKYRAALAEVLRYDPAALIEKQIAELVRQGHDVQLHLHPQWHSAEFRDGMWILDKTKNTVDELFKNQEDATRYIADRKQTLEQLAHAAEPAFSVSAYRAGAFCAQPGDRLLRALAANGILFDSSLVKGMFRNRYPRLDFRKAPKDLSYWRVSNDVSSEETSGAVIEVPVFSRMGRRYSQLTLQRLKAKFSSQVPKDKKVELLQELGVGINPLSVILRLFEPVPIKLDFHNLSGSALMRMVENAHQSDRAGQTPVHVAIGHTKEHYDTQEIERFIRMLQQARRYAVTTFTGLRSFFEMS